MNDISKWYEWREPSPTETSPARGQVNFKPYVSPIILACNNVQHSLLKSVDPILHGVLQSSGINSIYGLYDGFACCSRSELSMDDAMIIWDGLFASPIPISELAQWICVAMLIRIRTKPCNSHTYCDTLRLRRKMEPRITQSYYSSNSPPNPLVDVPYHLPAGLRPRNPLEIGRRNLDPFGGINPFRPPSLFPGNGGDGMFVGPDHPIFGIRGDRGDRSHGMRGPWGGDGYLNPSFNGRPRRGPPGSGNTRDPDNDEFMPPGAGDMFM
ncbi:hypothetical protein DEU56DRAFT_941427 [Suillus clintonianus]|uniref:uncharacterized protein n=1 Tax=Suillus clintonianus TaxID=1904413 RepID=UPI001B85BBE3|nr:uncharacterized protein DEU56DRAFT_941427 [Suillus clintonianus]KAG2141115.1 hypothetical protein DEU56DRAFT_941427 [Suillus clintonianus]